MPTPTPRASPRRRARPCSRPSRSGCATRPRPGVTPSISARGRCRRAPRRWSWNIPGVRGVDDSLIYFVDRYRDFSIYDVDFVPLPGSERRPPAIAGLHYFGVVQTILNDRTPEWVEFYRQLFGFSVLPGGQYFGILPKGTLLESPCHKFYLQLIEPPPGAEDIEWDERLLRIGLGAPDVLRGDARAARARRRVHRPRPGAADRERRAHPGLPGRRDVRAGREPSRRPDREARMNIDDFGMETITLAGPLEARLRAVRAGGFTQIMLSARDLVEHPGGRGGGGGAVRGERAARDRIPGAARFRGAVRAPARLQGRHRQGHARPVPARWARSCCSCARRPRRTRAATRRCWRATCASSRCSRCRWASASPTRRCPGASTSTSSRRPGTSSTRRPRQPGPRARFLPHARDQHRARRARLRRSGEDLPRSARRLHVAGTALARGAHQHRAALSRVSRRRRARRRKSPSSCAGSTRWATAATTASRCSTTTTTQLPLAVVAERARASVKWLTDQVSRRSLPMRRTSRRSAGIPGA